MKRLGLLLALWCAGSAFADGISLRMAGVNQGPILSLNCHSDAGLLCSRDAGAVGMLQCNAASATEPGCITPSSQTFAGNKTFTGTVKAPVIDAGVGAIGAFDIRSSTITGKDTAATLTLQSTTADATTSSTVPAMTFQLGSDITNTDLGWGWKDSAGNLALTCTEAGAVTALSSVTAQGLVSSSLAAAPALATTGTGWIESEGDTSANLQSRTCTSGRGCLAWDDTNTRWRSGSNGGPWSRVVEQNPDAGEPYGPVFELSGFQPSNSNAAIRAFKKAKVYPTTRPLSVAYTATSGGSGVGTNFWLTLVDTTSSTFICDAGFACGLGSGLSSTVECSGFSATSAAKHDIEMRIDCTTCDVGGCPIGNGSFFMQSLK